MPESPPKFLDLLRALSDAGWTTSSSAALRPCSWALPSRRSTWTSCIAAIPKTSSDSHEVLKALDAHYRGRPGRRLEPDLHRLASAGHQLLTSRLGPIDVLGTIDGGRDYEELVEH